MDRQKFESIVQTYGADTERWPHAHRADMLALLDTCLLYTSPSPRDYAASRMPSSA